MMKILLIEDEPTQGQWVKDQIERYGDDIEVVWKSSLDAAFDWLEENVPDIICFDPGLPKVSTINLRQVVKKLASFVDGDVGRVLGITGSERRSTIWAALSHALGGERDEFDQPRIFEKSQALYSQEGIIELIKTLQLTQSRRSSSGATQHVFALEGKLGRLESDQRYLTDELNKIDERLGKLDTIVRLGGENSPSIAQLCWECRSRLDTIEQRLTDLAAQLGVLVRAEDDAKRHAKLERIKFFYQYLGYFLIAGVAIAVLTVLNFLGIKVDVIELFKIIFG